MRSEMFFGPGRLALSGFPSTYEGTGQGEIPNVLGVRYLYQDFVTGRWGK
jgi:hypothetical protein